MPWYNSAWRFCHFIVERSKAKMSHSGTVQVSIKVQIIDLSNDSAYKHKLTTNPGKSTLVECASSINIKFVLQGSNSSKPSVERWCASLIIRHTCPKQHRDLVVIKVIERRIWKILSGVPEPSCWMKIKSRCLTAVVVASKHKESFTIVHKASANSSSRSSSLPYWGKIVPSEWI